MELQIKNDDEITLPGWLGGSSLTLAEIGGVVVLSCLDVDGDSESLAAKFADPEVQAVLESLKSKGIFKAAMNDGRITLTVDLDQLNEG